MWTPDQADEPPKTKTVAKKDQKPKAQKHRKLAKKVAQLASEIPDDSFESILLNAIRKNSK